jgi:aromatic-L-amino-acid decarboxylase
MRYFGRAGLAARLREHIRLARWFAEQVDADPDFERCAPAPFSTVCFRFRPHDLARRAEAHAGNGAATERVESYLNAVNESLLNRLNGTGRLFLSHTKLNGRYVLRFAIGNLRTTEAHVRAAWEDIQATAAELDDEMRIGAALY